VADFAWIRQERAEECGLEALAMVARYHGLTLGVADFRRLVALDSRGVNVSDLATAAGRVGLRANAVRVCPEFLSAITLPAVAHLRVGHFVTVFECGPASVTIGDPARGVVTRPLTAFFREWSGVVLLLQPPGGVPAAGRGPTCSPVSGPHDERQVFDP